MSTDRTTEILNYLSAISREVGAFRAETKERFAQVEERFTQVDARFGQLESDMQAGFEAVQKSIRLLERQFDEVIQDLMKLRGHYRDHELRIAVLERKQS